MIGVTAPRFSLLPEEDDDDDDEEYEEDEEELDHDDKEEDNVDDHLFGHPCCKVVPVLCGLNRRLSNWLCSPSMESFGSSHIMLLNAFIQKCNIKIRGYVIIWQPVCSHAVTLI